MHTEAVLNLMFRNDSILPSRVGGSGAGGTMHTEAGSLGG